VTTSIRWDIKSGLPFAKSLLVTLPTGRSWWTSVSDFELSFQVREDPDKASNLITDLKTTLTPTFMDADNLRVNVGMTGADTRSITESGWFDIIISDSGITNARGFPLIDKGYIRRTSVISKDAGE